MLLPLYKDRLTGNKAPDIFQLGNIGAMFSGYESQGQSGPTPTKRFRVSLPSLIWHLLLRPEFGSIYVPTCSRPQQCSHHTDHLFILGAIPHDRTMHSSEVNPFESTP